MTVKLEALCCQTCCFKIYLGQQSEGLKKRVLKPDFLFIFSTKNLSEEENDLSGFSGARMLPSRHDDLGKNRGVLGKWKEMAVSFQKKKKMFQQISNRDWQLCRATGSASSLLIRTPGTSSASSSSTSPSPSSSSSTGSGPTPWALFQTGAALLHPILQGRLFPYSFKVLSISVSICSLTARDSWLDLLPRSSQRYWLSYRVNIITWPCYWQPVQVFHLNIYKFSSVESQSQLQLWLCEGRNSGRLHQRAFPSFHIILHFLRGDLLRSTHVLNL